jgi:hypothetical protein
LGFAGGVGVAVGTGVGVIGVAAGVPWVAGAGVAAGVFVDAEADVVVGGEVTATVFPGVGDGDGAEVGADWQAASVSKITMSAAPIVGNVLLII